MTRKNIETERVESYDTQRSIQDRPLQKIPEHTIMLPFFQPKILLKHCLQFLLGVKMAPRETENKADAKCLGDKQRTL